MQAFMTTTRGLRVLFSVHMDKLMGMGAVWAALVLGAWLCSLALG